MQGVRDEMQRQLQHSSQLHEEQTSHLKRLHKEQTAELQRIIEAAVSAKCAATEENVRLQDMIQAGEDRARIAERNAAQATMNTEHAVSMANAEMAALRCELKEKIQQYVQEADEDKVKLTSKMQEMTDVHTSAMLAAGEEIQCLKQQLLDSGEAAKAVGQDVRSDVNHTDRMDSAKLNGPFNVSKCGMVGLLHRLTQQSVRQACWVYRRVRQLKLAAAVRRWGLHAREAEVRAQLWELWVQHTAPGASSSNPVLDPYAVEKWHAVQAQSLKVITVVHRELVEREAAAAEAAVLQRARDKASEAELASRVSEAEQQARQVSREQANIAAAEAQEVIKCLEAKVQVAEAHSRCTDKAAEATAAELRAQLVNSRLTCQKAEGQVAAIQAQQLALDTEIQGQKQAVENAKGALAAAEKAAATERAHHAVVEQEAIQARVMLSAEQQRVQTYVSRCEELEEVLKGQKRAMAAMEEAMASIHGAVGVGHGSVCESDEAACLRKQVAEAQQHIVVLEEEMTKAEKAAATERAQHAVVEQEAIQARVMLSAEQQRVQTYVSRCEELEEVLKGQKRAMAAMEEAMASIDGVMGVAQIAVQEKMVARSEEWVTNGIQIATAEATAVDPYLQATAMQVRAQSMEVLAVVRGVLMERETAAAGEGVLHKSQEVQAAAALKAQVTDAEEDVKRLSDALSSCEMEHSSVQAQLKEAAQRLDKTSEELQAAACQLAEAQDRLATLEEAVATAQMATMAERARREVADEELSEARDELHTEAIRAREATTRCQELEASLPVMQAALARGEALVAEAEERHEASEKTRKAEREQAQVVLKKERQKHEEAHVKMGAEAEQAQCTLTEKMEQCMALQAAGAVLQKLLEAKSAEARLYQAEVAKLTRERETAEEVWEQSRREVVELQAEREALHAEGQQGAAMKHQLTTARHEAEIAEVQKAAARREADLAEQLRQSTLRAGEAGEAAAVAIARGNASRESAVRLARNEGEKAVAAAHREAEGKIALHAREKDMAVEAAHTVRDNSLRERDKALKERDKALKERDKAIRECKAAVQEKMSALKAAEAAVATERAQLQSELERKNKTEGDTGVIAITRRKSEDNLEVLGAAGEEVDVDEEDLEVDSDEVTLAGPIEGGLEKLRVTLTEAKKARRRLTMLADPTTLAHRPQVVSGIRVEEHSGPLQGPGGARRIRGAEAPTAGSKSLINGLKHDLERALMRNRELEAEVAELEERIAELQQQQQQHAEEEAERRQARIDARRKVIQAKYRPSTIDRAEYLKPRVQ